MIWGINEVLLLGLLALLLGFTFSMSISRFDARKDLVLEEANAIGTAHLRAKFLPEQASGDVAALLRDYVAARIDFHAASSDQANLAAATMVAARPRAMIMVSSPPHGRRRRPWTRA